MRAVQQRPDPPVELAKQMTPELERATCRYNTQDLVSGFIRRLVPDGKMTRNERFVKQGYLTLWWLHAAARPGDFEIPRVSDTCRRIRPSGGARADHREYRSPSQAAPRLAWPALRAWRPCRSGAGCRLQDRSVHVAARAPPSGYPRS